MKTRRLAPSVNAGSMADIAFLLLIFFLVSTTIATDQGISRKLPPKLDDTPPITIRERNIFRVELNQLNELLVEGELISLKDLKDRAISFLDNGGGVSGEACSYCRGSKGITSSDNPKKAVISLQSSRETNYETYIAVQDQLVSAYTELRNREAIRLYGVLFTTMEGNLKSVHYDGDKAKLRERIKHVQMMYPEKISEAETKME